MPGGARDAKTSAALAYPKMINQQYEYGRTPLHGACSSGRPESVRLLLLAGARITILDKNKRTPLHACAEVGDEQRLWELLSRPEVTRGHIIQDRFRPVFGGRSAYRAWHAEGIYSPETKFQELTNIGLVVKILLSAGSDVMAVDSHDQSPLDLALLYDCQEMIEALEFSALPLMKKWLLEPDDPRLPTLLALKKLNSSPLSDIESEDLLCQEVYDNLSTYLHFLNFEEIMWIAQNGGNITGFDESKPVPSSGESLLYIAASTGLTQLVETFGTLARTNDDTETVRGRINEQLAVNPDYNPQVEKLAPKLHVACARELPNMDMIHVLIDKCGVDVNAHALVHQSGPGPQRWANIADSIEGGTALHVLAKSRYWWQLEALKYLLDNGAKVDALNENGETPLHIACTGTNFPAMNWENDV
ncbi:ankyrin [Hyaloscypha hepaticicola]|uniref:Ankyrin n=1 Tax=Hyaloscypha hepaticicola TaxID=2082293 RepID=A0A2J6PQC8_9HELO|nr:ankyrin [Hyaloscypha hepaticicola]